MKLARRTIALGAVLLITISAFGYFCWNKAKPAIHLEPKKRAADLKEKHDDTETLTRLYQKATTARHYSKAYGFNKQHCFFMDMRIGSGKNRFFVYNMQKDSVEIAGLVTHGGGSDNGSAELTFSNTPGSHCSSLGKYKIGKSYNGKFGLAYKLYGLEKSNSKAFDRFVVLHGHDCVPDTEVSPSPICVSQGCPTVSPVFLRTLKSYIDTSPEPILLWIYY